MYGYVKAYICFGYICYGRRFFLYQSAIVTNDNEDDYDDGIACLDDVK